MSEKSKQPSSEKHEEDRYPKTYWDFMNRLTLFALGMCAVFTYVPDVPALLQEKAEVYLYKVPLLWLLLVALPWLIKFSWLRRDQIRTKISERRKPIIHPEPQASGGFVDKVKAVVGGTESTVSISGVGSLQPTLAYLPNNPNPVPRAPLTVHQASELITTALQLAEFTVEDDVGVLKVESGPVLQMITFQLPPKVQLSKLASKKDDIANHLGKQQGFDVKAAKDHKSAASFIIPHAQEERAFVYLRDLGTKLVEYSDKCALPVVFGKDVYGRPMVHDLAKMPHLLVCGATGSGKSVYINTLLVSLTSMRSPQQVQLLLIDPKQVEFNVYQGLPHLLTPPVTDMKRAINMLYEIIDEMEERYEQFSKSGVRNLAAYNAKYPDQPLASIVVVIDEYADLMMVAGGAIEEAVTRITQKARAAGIHLILGTQRPSTDVVTGTIKSNLPSRVAFKLPSAHDYRTVLDRGAPHLLGFGDGVCMVQGGELQRFQSAAISVKDGEDTNYIEQLIAYWREQWTSPITWKAGEDRGGPKDSFNDDDVPSQQNTDEVPPWEEEELEPKEGLQRKSEQEPNFEQSQKTNYERALDIVRRDGGLSTSTIQRELRIGFAEVAAYAEQMMDEEIIGSYDKEKSWRPLLKQDDLVERIKLHICQHRNARTLDIRDQFNVRKEKVLDCFQILVEEGVLNSPESARGGYTIAWSEEEIEEYLKNSL